jgi:hypothetical protein
MGCWKNSLLDDLGLDVDAKHTMRRLYGSAISNLMAALYGNKLRQALRAWT